MTKESSCFLFLWVYNTCTEEKYIELNNLSYSQLNDLQIIIDAEKEKFKPLNNIYIYETDNKKRLCLCASESGLEKYGKENFYDVFTNDFIGVYGRYDLLSLDIYLENNSIQYIDFYCRVQNLVQYIELINNKSRR